MSKFTPGPWFLEDDGTIRSKSWGRSDQMGDYRGNIIADLCPALGCDRETWQNPARKHAQAESFANAHLLASALEMYEVLKYLRNTMNRFVDDTNMIDTIIAKAEGRHE